MDPLLAEQCDTGQGFLYGRPLSPTQLDIFLRTHLTQEPPLWVVPPKQAAPGRRPVDVRQSARQFPPGSSRRGGSGRVRMP